MTILPAPSSPYAPDISLFLDLPLSCCPVMSHCQITLGYPQVFLLFYPYIQQVNRYRQFQLKVPFKSPRTIFIPLEVFMFKQEFYLTDIWSQ